MLNRTLSLTRLFASLVIASSAIIASGNAVANPILIDPSKEYQGDEYITNGGGNAYDFCFDNKTLGYIVVSEATSERLERRYPVRSNCTIPTTSTTNSNSFSQNSSSSQFYPVSASRPIKKLNRCQEGYATYFREQNGKQVEVSCPRRS